MSEHTAEKKTHQQMKGVVVSDKMDKTVVVEVKRYVKHPKYSKYYGAVKRFQAHDPENTYSEGDEVYIVPTNPLSKNKHFIVSGNA